MELTILQFFARWVSLENKNENILIKQYSMRIKMFLNTKFTYAIFINY